MRDPLRSMPAGEPQVPVDRDTLATVGRRIADRAREYGLTVESTTTVSLRPFDSTSTYPLYLAEIASSRGPAQHLVVKFAPVFASYREGQTEFTNLHAMYARLGAVGHLHVPRPLDYWEDVNALITEHRPGARFSTRILAARPWGGPQRTRVKLVRTSLQCGEWLRVYHDVTARGEGPAIDERFMATMKRDLGRMASIGALHALRGPIEDAFGAVCDTLSGRSAPVSVRHGDFSPDNVHLDGDGICVFDLSHHLPAPVYDDVTFFLVTLDTMNPYPRHWAFDRRVARALVSPFLEGYFGAERAGRESADSAVMAAYMLKNLLARCLKQRRVAAARGPLALAAFDSLWVVGRYHKLLVRAMSGATARG